MSDLLNVKHTTAQNILEVINNNPRRFLFFPKKLTQEQFVILVLAPLVDKERKKKSKNKSYSIIDDVQMISPKCSMFSKKHIGDFMNGNMTQGGKTSHADVLRAWADYLYSNNNAYGEIVSSFEELKRFGTEQRNKLFSLFNEDKLMMPEWFSSIAERKFAEHKDSEFVCLLFLWSIYGRELLEQELAFLPKLTGDPETLGVKLKARPIKPSPVFIARDDLLDEIHTKLTQKDHCVFLQGMGGIGKTEAVKQYVEKYANQYEPVVFAECDNTLTTLLNDDNVFTLMEPFVERRMQEIDGQSESDVEYYKRKLAFLRKTVDKRTLIVLDNVDHHDEKIEDFLALNCPVIITTRWMSQELYPDITIKIETSCDLPFCRRVFWAHFFNDINYDKHQPQWKLKDIESDQIVNKIINHFNGHILSLELVAKQMKVSRQTTDEIWEYIQNQQEQELEDTFLIPNKSKDERNMINHILQIFKMSALSVDKIRILFWLSHFPKSGVDISVFRRIISLNNYVDLNDLKARSWVREDDGLLSIHPLIAEGVQLSYEPEQTDETASIYFEIGNIFNSKSDYRSALNCLTKALSIQEIVHGNEHPITAKTYNTIGWTYQVLSDYTKALDYFVKAMAIVEIVFGTKDLESALVYNNVAVVYHAIGDYSNALEYFTKALTIREEILGKEHPSTASVYNNIIGVYHAMGDFDKAMEYTVKSKDIRENTLGTDTIDTATSYLNIAGIAKEKGDYKEALKYSMKALPIFEKILGANHPDTATAYNNTASVYEYMGDYDKAAEYYKKALTIQEEKLGKSHLSTATTYNNIAGLYHKTGELNTALEYYNKALTIFEKVLGTEHPNLAVIYGGIASVYHPLGDSNKALEYLQKSISIVEKAFGTEHPRIAISYANVAEIYKDKGDYGKALEFLLKALSIQEKNLGMEHPDTAHTYGIIAAVYLKMRNLNSALEFLTKKIDAYKKTFGAEHPNTGITYSNIAEVYRAKGDMDNALKYNLISVSIFEKTFGTEHPTTATAYNNSADVYLAKGDLDNALKYNLNAMHIREKVLGTEHPSTATSYNNIARVYQKLREWDKALEYAHKAERILEVVFGKEHPHTQSVYMLICMLYSEKGDRESALQYQEKAQTFLKTVLNMQFPTKRSSETHIISTYNPIVQEGMCENQPNDDEQ